MSGISVVETTPQFRNRGFVRKLMEKIIKEDYNNKTIADTGKFNCFDLCLFIILQGKRLLSDLYIYICNDPGPINAFGLVFYRYGRDEISQLY